MQKEDRKLRGEPEACRQIMELDQAVMAAILEKTGAVTVAQADIRRHLQEKRQVRAEQTADGFRLWTEAETG